MVLLLYLDFSCLMVEMLFFFLEKKHYNVWVIACCVAWSKLWVVLVSQLGDTGSHRGHHLLRGH